LQVFSTVFNHFSKKKKLCNTFRVCRPPPQASNFQGGTALDRQARAPFAPAGCPAGAVALGANHAGAQPPQKKLIKNCTKNILKFF
jgi:hypothetical protein